MRGGAHREYLCTGSRILMEFMQLSVVKSTTNWMWSNFFLALSEVLQGILVHIEFQSHLHVLPVSAGVANHWETYLVFFFSFATYIYIPNQVSRPIRTCFNGLVSAKVKPIKIQSFLHCTLLCFVHLSQLVLQSTALLNDIQAEHSEHFDPYASKNSLIPKSAKCTDSLSSDRNKGVLSSLISKVLCTKRSSYVLSLINVYSVSYLMAGQS